MSTYTEDFATAGAIAGAGTTLAAIGKYYSSNRVLNKSREYYQKKLRVANLFEKSFTPSVQFNYTTEDIIKDTQRYIKEEGYKNGKEWVENAKRNLEIFKESNRKMCNADIANRIRKSVTFRMDALPTVGAAHNLEELYLTPKPNELFGNMDKYFERLGAKFIPGREKTKKNLEFLQKLRQEPFLMSANPKIRLITNLIIGMTAIGATYFTAKGLAKLFEKQDVVENTQNQQNQQIIESNASNTQPTETQIEKQIFIDAYKELGVSEDTELIEYVPQKGEYWISILKAKYGVSDEIALEMAHKIKGAIYDDPNASKQSPVMYLPKTWNFNGETYHYTENSQVEKTDKYSEDVKTEMGKMNKKLKYD